MVYRNIDGRNRNRRSNRFNAYEESIRGEDNMKTLEKIRMAKAIENVLPHGSGINVLSESLAETLTTIWMNTECMMRISTSA